MRIMLSELYSFKETVDVESGLEKILQAALDEQMQERADGAGGDGEGGDVLDILLKGGGAMGPGVPDLSLEQAKPMLDEWKSAMTLGVGILAQRLKALSR